MSTETRQPISIWQPQTIDGEAVFVRPEPGPFDDHCAATRVIHRERQRPHRLCLLGESTAAGYLLAPRLTPARVLEHCLGGGWEVVDLARTNERLDRLAATAEAAMQLAPDRLVVFAGNNWNLLETPEWSPYAPSTAARAAFAEALRGAGPAGPARAAAAGLRRRVEATFARLADLGVPLTVVVPEVNLADWESPQPVHWLPGRRVAGWHRLLAAARRALAAGDLGVAQARTAELLELDGGSVPTGFRLLTRIFAARGDRENARTAARAEVDSVRYPVMALLAAPQATATAQELAREAAARHRFDLVDLPAVFSRETRLPGRELFYDYCHLTPEGIDLAMAAVAGSIAVGPAAGQPPAPSRRTRAAAELGAAIHGVHRGSAGEPVRDWLRRAITTHPGAADVLLDVVAARAAPVPAVLTRRQLSDPWLNHQHGWKWPYLDAEVLAAAGEVLGWEKVRPLLGPPRLEPWSPLDRFYPEAMEHEEAPMPLFLRAPWPWSSFALVAGGPVEIEIVARLPATSFPRGGRIDVGLDGRRAQRLEIGPSWARHRLALPARTGLNRLEVRWPLPECSGEDWLASAVERLAAGRQADLHPVFGEVQALRIVSATARGGSRASPCYGRGGKPS